MPIYLEMLNLESQFPFRIIYNDGNILTTPHWHREIELIYVTKGQISLGIDDVPYTLSKGEIAFVDSGLIHYILASPGSERVVYQFELQAFLPIQLTLKAVEQRFSMLQPVSNLWSKADYEMIHSLLKRIEKEQIEKAFGYQMAIQSALQAIMVNLLRSIPTKQLQAQRVKAVTNQAALLRLDEIFHYVEDHYREEISLEEIAMVSGYSTFHFTRFFKKNTGKTFLSFLNEYRIDKAKWFLINTEMSVSEVISNTGFESDKTFYRLFKKIMGMAPLAYRQKMKKI